MKYSYSDVCQQIQKAQPVLMRGDPSDEEAYQRAFISTTFAYMASDDLEALISLSAAACVLLARATQQSISPTTQSLAE